jgi:hypothetical protein
LFINQLPGVAAPNRVFSQKNIAWRQSEVLPRARLEVQ